MRAISDRHDFTTGLGQQGRNSSTGSSKSESEQLHKTPLMTPDEVSRFFSRENGAVLALIAGALPVRLERLAAHADPFFKERSQKNPFHS